MTTCKVCAARPATCWFRNRPMCDECALRVCTDCGQRVARFEVSKVTKKRIRMQRCATCAKLYDLNRRRTS